MTEKLIVLRYGRRRLIAKAVREEGQAWRLVHVQAFDDPLPDVDLQRRAVKAIAGMPRARLIAALIGALSNP